MFIVRTQHGYKQREQFEEVKPAPIITITSQPVEAANLTSWFFESLTRLPSSQQNPSGWLRHVLSSGPSLATLRMALLAVAITRYSRSIDRPDILQRGRQLYIGSLQCLRKDLAQPQMILHDDILAAVCVMLLYELFDATNQNLDGWLEHLSGLQYLLQYRGPDLHSSAIARSILEHSRYLIVLRQLIRRKGCILSNQKWLSIPWPNGHKSVEQQVVDEGLKLAAVFECCDRAALGVPLDIRPMIAQCASIYNGIECLTAHFLQQMQTMHPGPKALCEPQDLAATLLHITALWIKLGACASVSFISSAPSNVIYGMPKLPGGEFERSSRVPKNGEIFAASCRPTARLIICMAQSCFHCNVGAFGAARMVIAVQLAMEQFGTMESEFKECRVVLDKLCPLARGIGSMAG